MSESKKDFSEEKRTGSIFGARVLPRTVAEIQEEVRGCTREQERTINSRKTFTVIIIIFIVTIPVVLPLLLYYYMIDGVVEFRVSENFSVPSFQAYWQAKDFTDPDAAIYVNGENVGIVKYDIVDFRFLFGSISRARTSEDILAAYLYNDDTYEDLDVYFCRFATMGRSINIIDADNVSSLRGMRETVRVPQGEMFLMCVVTLRSQNVSTYFSASFVAAFGNEFDNVVDGNKMVVTVEGATFYPGYFGQWLSWWADPVTTLMPAGSPWTLTVTVEKQAYNPDLWNPRVR